MTESTLKKIQELASKHEVYGDLFIKGAEALHKIYVEMGNEFDHEEALSEYHRWYAKRVIFRSVITTTEIFKEGARFHHLQSSAQISALKEEIERLKTALEVEKTHHLLTKQSLTMSKDQLNGKG